MSRSVFEYFVHEKVDEDGREVCVCGFYIEIELAEQRICALAETLTQRLTE